MNTKTPHDLALVVYGRLASQATRLSTDILEEIFNVLFVTSLKSEERTALTCTVAYVDPKNVDPNPPARIRDHRWQFAPLETPLDFNVSQLSKIAMAIDPECSSLAVYPDHRGNLKIWGVFDQQGGFQSALKHEPTGGFAPPGVLQAQIIGLGHILVMDDLLVLAELHNGALMENTVDVLKGALITDRITSSSHKWIDRICSGVEGKGFRADRREIGGFTLGAWMTTIRRILLRARSYGHGGAYLFTDSETSSTLNVKYKLKYSRIPELIAKLMRSSVLRHQGFDLLLDQLDADADSVDQELYFANVCAGHDESDALEALTGAVQFVAALSRVDGLVLMDSELVVHGFGCEIIASGDDDCKFYRASQVVPSKGGNQRLDLSRFGMRHRSMARYCSEDESAVGFVISNDGPVQAFARRNKRVYFWENIQLTWKIATGKDD